MLLPARRCFFGLGAAALASVVSLQAALGAALAVVALALLDFLLVRRLRPGDLEITFPRRMRQGAHDQLLVTVVWRGGGPLVLELAVDVPRAVAGATTFERQKVVVPARTRGEFGFELVAHQRGRHAPPCLHVRQLGPLRLAWRQDRRDAATGIDVLPAARYEGGRRHLLAHARQQGLRAVRRRGDLGEFESLREYVRGDDPRRIDWKSTAKRRTTMVRQYQDERSQNLMIVIDCGRLMLERVSGRARLDWAAAAACALADAARTWQDHVGLLAFSDTVQTLLLPARHPADRVPALLAQMQAKAVEPDYPRALVALSRALKRRSLLVFLGDVIDPEVSAPLAVHLARLARRHLPLFVALRHPDLETTAYAPVADGPALAQRAAATELLLARARTLEGMRHAGIRVLDVPPAASVAAAVEHYTKIKRRGAL